MTKKEQFLIDKGWSYNTSRNVWYNHRKYFEMYLSLWEALKIEGWNDMELLVENTDKRLLHNREGTNYRMRHK